MAQKMGVSKGYVSLIESGKRTVVDQAKLLKLASKLAVNSEWLLSGYGDPSKPTDPSVLSVLAGLAPSSLPVRLPVESVAGAKEKDSICDAGVELDRALNQIEAGVMAMRQALKRLNK